MKSRMNPVVLIYKNSLIISLFILLGLFDSTKGLCQPNQFKLNSVKFIGIQSVSKNQLSKTLASQAPSQWKFWAPKSSLTTEDLQEDILRIKQFYKEHGYYQCEATYQTTILSGKEEIAEPSQKEIIPSDELLPLLNVTFSITEGPPVLIKTIDLEVKPETQNLSDQELRKALPLRIGQIFETDKYSEAKKMS